MSNVAAIRPFISTWTALGLDHQTWAKLIICEQNAEQHREQAYRYSDRLDQARQDPRTPLYVLDRLQGYVLENLKEAQWWDAQAAEVRFETGLVAAAE